MHRSPCMKITSSYDNECMYCIPGIVLRKHSNNDNVIVSAGVSLDAVSLIQYIGQGFSLSSPTRKTIFIMLSVLIWSNLSVIVIVIAITTIYIAPSWMLYTVNCLCSNLYSVLLSSILFLSIRFCSALFYSILLCSDVFCFTLF